MRGRAHHRPGGLGVVEITWFQGLGKGCRGRRAPSNTRLLRSLMDSVAVSRDLGVNLDRRDFSREALKPSSSLSAPPGPGPCTAQSPANWGASATVSLPPGLRRCPANSARALRWSCFGIQCRFRV